MRHGFVKVAAATPDIRVADVEFNKENICRGIEEAEKANAKILVFPELCVTGYTCSDLFDHAVLLKAAKKALLEIAEFTRDRDLLVFVGVPLEVDGKLYNVAAALNHGKILVWFLSPFLLPNSQCEAYSLHWYKHQCCFVRDYILQILFSSYLISWYDVVIDQ